MQYRVLLVTSFGKPWNDGWFYKAGFEKNGHTVIPFDPAVFEKPESRILEIVKESKPDFILHTKDELSPDIFHELKGIIKVVMWYPDSVIPAWLFEYVKACDIFFTMSEGLIPQFKRYNPNVFWLTQAFAPSFFDIKDITPQDVEKYSSDVTFVGNLSSKKPYLPRRRYLERVINEGFQLKWWGPRIPRKLSTLPLIFGKLGRCYGGRFIWGEEYAKAARLSKIFLAFDAQPHIEKSMSERMYTAVGCGAFYMCRYVNGIEEILEPDREIVTFQSEQEMIDKIRYYLKNDELRMKIAEAGRGRVLKEHTYEIRIRQMLEIVENVLR